MYYVFRSSALFSVDNFVSYFAIFRVWINYRFIRHELSVRAILKNG